MIWVFENLTNIISRLSSEGQQLKSTSTIAPLSVQYSLILTRQLSRMILCDHSVKCSAVLWHVSERTCCHITDFRFEFTPVGYQSIACLKPRFEGGGREYSHIWAIIIHVCRVFWGSRNRWSIFITGWGFKTHTPITHVSDICGSTPWGYDVCDVFSVHVRSITIFSQVISL